jgi:hypothetical protein
LLYIPNNTVNHPDMFTSASCLKNLGIRVHFPSKFTASTPASSAHAGTATPFGAKPLVPLDDAFLSSTMALLTINLDQPRYESLIIDLNVQTWTDDFIVTSSNLSSS